MQRLPCGRGVRLRWDNWFSRPGYLERPVRQDQSAMDNNQCGRGIDPAMQLWWINGETGVSHLLIPLSRQVSGIPEFSDSGIPHPGYYRRKILTGAPR